jgi:hypothetical protein
MWKAAPAIASMLAMMCIGGCAGRGSRMNVQELVQALRAGEIKPGTKLPVARLPKGWAGTRITRDGEYGTYVAMDDTDVVMLHVHSGGLMYAAVSYSRLREHWYFCDTEALRQHAESGLAARAAPTEQPQTGK